MPKRRCTYCKCPAIGKVLGHPTCSWHTRFGEHCPPCPHCRQYEYRWTYTPTGRMPSRKVQMRQVCLKNHVFLDSSREMVLDIECVKEEAPLEWPVLKRFTTIMIGLGQQIGVDYWITQWASDWERELIEAAQPTLALATKIYIAAFGGNFDAEVLAGNWVSIRERWDEKPLWPAIDIRKKVFNIHDVLKEQEIGKCVDRTGDIPGKKVHQYWNRKDHEPVWKHNYLDVFETTHQIFQIEWPI